MKHFYIIWVVIFTTIHFSVYAQERIVTGKITSATDGGPLPGVSITIKGVKVGKGGTSTDVNGKYRIAVASADATLIYSFIGFERTELVAGARQVIDVVLKESGNQLSEVVVTALGFKESADRLAATSSRIKGSSIANSGETGLINGLAGKASGVKIQRTGGDPGAGSFIQIRGLSTITGDNQPLIVIDGIPVSNSTVGGTIGGVLPQSRLNDINPDDIAAVQILKGASAAALWGSRAANGVVIITTKKGNSEKLNISFSTSYSLDKVNAYHDLQGNYGQGTAGVYDPAATNSWGDKIAARAGGADQVNTGGAYFEAENGNKYYPLVKKNSQQVFKDSNYDQVFRNGSALDNSISLSGGNDRSNIYFSAGDLYQKGVLNGNSDYHRTSFRLNADRKFSDQFRISTTSAFTKIASKRQGRGNNGAVPFDLLRNPPDFDISDYKGTYYSAPGATPELNRQRSYRSYLGALANPLLGNPLWALNDQVYKSDVNRFINSIEFNYKPANWLDLTARAGYDTYTDELLDYFPVNDTPASGRGQFTQQVNKEDQWTTDLIGRIVKRFDRNLSLTYTAGFGISDRRFYNSGVTATNFIIADGPINPNNAVSANRTPFSTRTHVRTARLYNTASFSAFDALFLNVSAAAETGSTFGTSKNTFYYPSADIAWQFSKLTYLKDYPFLTFGKLRASYGVVGVQPVPYKTQTNFVSAAFSQGVLGDNITGAQYGNGAFLRSSEQGNDLLKPERKTEYEAGIDLRFWHDRLRAGFTYYSNKVEDVLIPVTLPASTGFISKYSNSASLQNRGIEGDLGIDVVNAKDFKWSVNANFNRNRNKVTSLAGTSSLFLTGIVNFVDVRAVENQPVGVIWYGKYQRNADNSFALDANNFPKLGPAQGVIGDPNPDWGGGLGSTLIYKKLSLDVLFETSQGGDFYEGTRGVLYNFGTHADVGNEVTLTQNLKNYAGVTIPAGTTLRGNIKDFGGGPVLLDESYYTSIGGGFSDLKEHLITDGSWTRLRQLTLSYHFDDKSFIRKTPLKSVDISVTGRNLFLWTKVKGIDPDINLTGNPLGKGLDYFNTPNTRSYLLSLRINY